MTSFDHLKRIRWSNAVFANFLDFSRSWPGDTGTGVQLSSIENACCVSNVPLLLHLLYRELEAQEAARKGWDKGGIRVGSQLIAQALLGLKPAQVCRFDAGTISFLACLWLCCFFLRKFLHFCVYIYIYTIYYYVYIYIYIFIYLLYIYIYDMI